MEFNGTVTNDHNFSEDEEDDEDLEEISKELKERPSPPATLSDHYDQIKNSYATNPSHNSNSSTIPPASSNIPLSSSDETEVAKTSPTLPPSRIDNIKAWSFSTYKFTKQLISERLGHVSRTVDAELECQIEGLRDTHQKYLTLLKLTKSLAVNLTQTMQTQKSLGDTFSQLSLKNPELHEEFTCNSETQRTLCKNGEILLGALNFFLSSMNTLCNKTIEDTLLTVRNYEAARVEYDAYRVDMETMQAAANRDSNHLARLDDATLRYQAHKEKFDGLRSDVVIKMKFLDENRVKVMHKQLALFHNAVASFFSGNQQSLEHTMRQFNIRIKPPTQPSWLEEHK